MKTNWTGFFAAFLLLAAAAVVPTTASAQDELTCEEARCAFQQMLTEECSCTEASNHGQHVSCVAHLVKQLSKDDQIPTNCKGKLKRCAARSVCGKQDRGFVTCSFVEYGTCLPGDTLTGPVCEHDPLQACTVDTDCVVSSKCRIKSSAERCTESGGAVNEAPSCCSNCTAPPA